MRCCTSMLEGIFRYNYTWRFKNPLLSYALILMVEAASTYCDETSSIYNSPLRHHTFHSLNIYNILIISIFSRYNKFKSIKSRAGTAMKFETCWNWLIKWLMFRAGKNHQVSILIYRTHYLARAHDWDIHEALSD